MKGVLALFLLWLVVGSAGDNFWDNWPRPVGTNNLNTALLFNATIAWANFAEGTERNSNTIKKINEIILKVDKLAPDSYLRNLEIKIKSPTFNINHNK